MELTKEYFDQGITNILGKMATKNDLKAQSQELKQYVHQAFELHQEWTEELFKEQITVFDVRDRVKRLEKDVAQLKLGNPQRA